MWKALWKKTKVGLIVLLVLAVLAGVASLLHYVGWWKTEKPADPTLDLNSTYGWIAGYLQWDYEGPEDRAPLYAEQLAEGGELRYIAEALTEWGYSTFEEWEVIGVVPWRGMLLLRVYGTPVEPIDGGDEIWVVLFVWVQETGRYELVWAECIDTVDAYMDRIGA
jgi:hypothetical protein